MGTDFGNEPGAKRQEHVAPAEETSPGVARPALALSESRPQTNQAKYTECKSEQARSPKFARIGKCGKSNPTEPDDEKSAADG